MGKKLDFGAVTFDSERLVKPLTSYTAELAEAQSKTLQVWLRDHDFEFREVPYSRFAARNKDVSIVQYESGKLVVQGKGTREFVEFVLEPHILGEARLGYEAVHNPEMLLPRIGIDESGKGDFFGPLCISAVYVNERILEQWREAGVRDSKNISSDKRIGEIAKVIRGTAGAVQTVVVIGNETYNRLYAKMRSVHKLLAWGHARVLENVLERAPELDPAPVRAVSDQFASDKKVIEGALLRLGRSIELVQRHRAEEDLAVAAASILARDEFVRRLAAMEREHGIKLPKGASAAVDAAAKEFVERYGAEKLGLVAKMHFRTALRAQGLPEPPRQEWRRGSESGMKGGVLKKDGGNNAKNEKND